MPLYSGNASEPGQPPAAPDTTVSAQQFIVLVRQAATETALALPGDKTLRFGEQIDIKVIASTNGKEGNEGQMSGRQIAGYLAKYVTKSVADFGIGVRRFSPAAMINSKRQTMYARFCGQLSRSPQKGPTPICCTGSIPPAIAAMSSASHNNSRRR